MIFLDLFITFFYFEWIISNVSMIYMDITLSPNDYNARKGVMKILLNGLPSLLINFKTSNKQCLVFFFVFWSVVWVQNSHKRVVKINNYNFYRTTKLPGIPKRFYKLFDKSVLAINVLKSRKKNVTLHLGCIVMLEKEL